MYSAALIDNYTSGQNHHDPMQNTSSLSERLTESLILQQEEEEDPNSSTAASTDSSSSTPRRPQSQAAQSPAAVVEQLKSLLRQTLRVTILDGRIFLGTFAGTDRLLNVLLINTDEFKLTGPSSNSNPNPNGRFVGLILVPWRLVIKIEVHTLPRDGGEVDPDPGVGLRGIVDRLGYEDDGLYS